MLTVKNDTLFYNDKALGPAASIYVDYNELTSMLKMPDGVVREQTPHRIDMIFTIGDQVWGCESKKPVDLIQSHAERRLARQIHTILEECGNAIILCRSGLDVGYFNLLMEAEAAYRTLWNPKDFWQDMCVRFPALGVKVLMVPNDDEKVLKAIEMYREVLTGVGAMGAILRDDRDKKIKLNRKGQFLENLKGLGPTMSKKLRRKFKTTRGALNASAEEWAELKIPKAVIKRYDEAMK